MANYFTCVELEASPTKEAYEKLDAAMAVAGFLPTAMADKRSFKMPHAFYAKQGSTQSLSEANASAVEAAASVQSKYVLVTVESNAWLGWVKAV